MDNYDDFLNGINSQDREEKNTKIINEFKAFLKLNSSVYNTFAGVKAEIENILNNSISADEAEYYQKLFPSFFVHLKNIKADLSFFPEYTFVPEYKNIIDKHYTFIMRDMTLAEAETSRQRMLQLLEENKNKVLNPPVNKPTTKEKTKLHYNINDIIEQIVDIIIGEDCEFNTLKIEPNVAHFELNSIFYVHDNYWENRLDSWTNEYKKELTGVKYYDLETKVKFSIDFRHITGYCNFENRFSIIGSNALIKEKGGFSKELNYDYNNQFIYPNLRTVPLPIISKQIPTEFSWFNWKYNELNFQCSNSNFKRNSHNFRTKNKMEILFANFVLTNV